MNQRQKVNRLACNIRWTFSRALKNPKIVIVSGLPARCSLKSAGVSSVV